MRRLVLPLLCALAAGAAAQNPGGAGPADERAEVLKALEPIPAWCQENGLFKERDRAWRTILVLSPDHAAARKALQYTRAPDGAWRQSSSYREPTTTNKDKAPEFASKWNEAVGGYVEKSLAAAAARPATLKPAAREELLAFLVELNPEDPRIRDARGEVKRGARWLLKETVAALGRRNEMAALAAKCLAAGKTSEFAPDDSVKLPGVALKFCVKSPRVLALATTTKEDATLTAQQTHAGLELVDALFEGPDFRGSGATIYLVGGADEANAVIGARPIAPDMSQYFLRCGGGAWLDEKNAVVAMCHDTVRQRVDSAVRALLDHAIGERVNLTNRMDVLSQGLTVVIMGWLNGTRLPQLGPRDVPWEAALLKTLSDHGTDWEKVARDVIRANHWPKPGDALGAAIPDATPSAQLYGEVATMFLMLGRPDRYQAVFKAIRPMNGPGPAIQSVLETDLDSFDLRLRRWLQEMSELAPDSKKPGK
jgi:hypothetical protein